MDIMNVAQQLISYLGKDPKLITQFIEHPYSTTAKAAGTKEQISKADMSQIITAAAALASGQPLGGSDVANIASALLGQNNNSVHSLAASLLGSGSSQGVDLTSGLTKSIMGGFSKGIDLSDGIDAKDAIGLISMFLK